MIIEIGAPHILPLFYFIYYKMRQCWDRSCTLDKSKTKKKIQSNYEKLYIGPEFMLDARLA